MNRRGHLSNKIPNVKLRPVPSAPSSRTRGNARSPSPLTGMDAVINQREMEGEEDEEVSTAALRNVERPWKGVVITFTGVEQKIRLAGLAGELGAKVESALTVNVTHVVAGAFGSDKYYYAVEHRLPVLTPEWIEINHELWLSGGDVEGSIEPYRLRPFTGLTISISGIEQLDRRKQILGAVKQFGGTYLKDLDRSCTHLVIPKPASELKSSAKVKFVLDDIRERGLSRRRGKKVQGHEMRLVYEEWIWDCIGFNGRFKEDDYDARKPKKDGKVKAEDVLSGDVLMDEEAGPKKEPREEDGPAVIRKRKREDIESLVGNLISTTMAKVEAGSDADITPSRPSRRGTASSELRKSSLLHATRTASFGPSKSDADPLPTPSMPATAPQPPTAELLGDKLVAPPIFAGLRIGHLIDEAYGGLERAIVAHGATFVTEEQRLRGDQVDYVIVRLAAPKHPKPVNGQPTPTIVTECWIEGCCFEQALLPIDKHIVFRPLPAPMPIGGTAEFSIHLSGISAEGNTYLRRLIRVIGASQAVSLNRQTTHLVSGKKDGPKVDKAREWGIKVVSEAWLFAMGKSGHVEPESDYPVDSTSTTTVTGDDEAEAVKPVSVSKSQSQARALKPTPTHVDDQPGHSSMSGSTSAFTSATNSNLAPDIPSGPTNPLSPPEGPSTSARKLNQASVPDSRDVGASSIGKEDRTNKARLPVQESIGTSGRNREMTDVLRQLAEKGDTSASRIKAPRRSKGALRGRTSTTLAQRNTTSISPDKRSRSERDRDSSPISPDGEFDHLISAQPVYDESMRVSIADPAAERERKKMMDALRRTSQLGVGGGSRVGR